MFSPGNSPDLGFHSIRLFNPSDGSSIALISSVPYRFIHLPFLAFCAAPLICSSVNCSSNFEVRFPLAIEPELRKRLELVAFCGRIIQGFNSHLDIFDLAAAFLRSSGGCLALSTWLSGSWKCTMLAFLSRQGTLPRHLGRHEPRSFFVSLRLGFIAAANPPCRWSMIEATLKFTTAFPCHHDQLEIRFRYPFSNAASFFFGERVDEYVTFTGLSSLRRSTLYSRFRTARLPLRTKTSPSQN